MDFFGDLRAKSNTPDFLAKQQAAWTRLGITPGPGTQLYKPPANPVTPPPVIPPPTPPSIFPGTPTGQPIDGPGGGPINENPSAYGQPPGKLFGQQFGNYNPGPSVIPPGMGGNVRSGTDSDYPFPRYLSLLGVGNNLL